MSVERLRSLHQTAWPVCAALLLGLGSAEQSAEEGGETAWEEVAVEGGRIAVPRGWRNLDSLKPPLYRQGDGIGMVPPTDETGSPLQIGISVERHAATAQTVQEVAADLVEVAKHLRNLELLRHDVETLQLTDGTDAVLLKVQFLKEASRRSLQMKLVAKDEDATVWIVTGHVVGGGESTWPTPGSALAKWLAAHITSFTLDGKKFDVARIQAAYVP